MPSPLPATWANTTEAPARRPIYVLTFVVAVGVLIFTSGFAMMMTGPACGAGEWFRPGDLCAADADGRTFAVSVGDEMGLPYILLPLGALLAAVAAGMLSRRRRPQQG